MLISKTIKVRLNNQNITKLKNLGYSLPTKKGARGGIVAIKGAEVEIKIEHASKYSKSLVLVQCDYCGEIKEEKYSNYTKGAKSGSGYACFNCKHKKQIEVLSKQVRHYVKIFNDSGYDVKNNLDDVVYKNFKFKLICENNHLWETTYDNFKGTKHGCPQCSGNEKWTYFKMVEKMEEFGCSVLSGSEEFKNRDSIIHFICHCGNKTKKSFSGYMWAQCCDNCRSNKKHTTEEVYIEFKNRGWTLISEYVNGHENLIYICERGHLGDITYQNFKRGTGCSQCHREKFSGKNHPNYNHGKTDEERLKDRKYKEYADWQNSVYKRDSYTCQICGYEKGGILNAHHKDGYGWCIERRTDITNGVTICKDCHSLFHKTYGYGGNTEDQWNEFVYKIGSGEIKFG